MSIFSKVPVKRPKRNKFNLSYENRFSCKMGELIPVMCKPVVPGDTFNVNTEIFIRTAPLVSPLFQQIDVYLHYFFVPNRLIYKDWEQFISPHGTKSEPDPQEKQLPAISGFYNYRGEGFDESSINDHNGTLLDFLGYRIVQGEGVSNLTENTVFQSLLPVNAYNLIYQQYYQDQNVGKSSTIDDPVILDESLVYDADWTTSAGDYENLAGEPIVNYFNLRQRCWKKDYFTSALPFTQRGDDVRIPLYGSANLVPSGQSVASTEKTSVWSTPVGSPSPAGNFDLSVHNDSGSNAYSTRFSSGSSTYNLTHDHGILGEEIAKVVNVDLSNVSAATINELRRAIQTQKFAEISARFGGRYKEYVLGYFGISINDGRLQRAEYLGGGVQSIRIGDVFQTSSSVQQGEQVSPLGDLAGRGSCYGNQNHFKTTFVEHGYVMAIMSIQPRAAYYQGINKDLSKMDRLDFYNPVFANLGEQPIYNFELFRENKDVPQQIPFGTFGYTPRYAEYKFSLGEIHGEFRDSLNTWHDARKFGTTPTLSKGFLEVNEFKDGLNRIFAVEGTESQPVEHFYCYVNHNITALRPMPYFGVPLL
nr:MAG TPA: Major capsid protein [Microviridae sp.]